MKVCSDSLVIILQLGLSTLKLVALKLSPGIAFDLSLVALRKVFELSFQWSQCEEFSLIVQLLSLTLLKIPLLLGQLLREYFLLVVEDLEVLFRAQELIVKILGLFLGLYDVRLLGLDDFFEFPLLDHHEVIVTLLASKLCL